ncbi:protocatechuate 3,4-dioxygenase alpha subunit [Thermocatellispora tengchongensis]|uniref:Protocatechuate 3,4-dioxygenase alpha subunit n=1 Tax=Thermocatellispora tengchongensis TaxID=1073253 RepID=A0A840PB81_9ACTN|nr:protocatechuate 3,4-dioxygenase subunit alpha [Thermocatellispora tengchongensis]MBB5136502.1 protocatechuate 3,4-dioxygenase alpha subunit [Thermocatellispora tengchongensis]
MPSLPLTPSQTVGPFFAHALPFPEGPYAVPEDHPGAILLHGHVYDGNGDPVPDALLEICQPGGIFGRCETDKDGRYHFRAARPETYISLLIFARGLLRPLWTRIYLDGDDPFLTSVDADRRATLIARPEPDGSYRFDVRLQGEGETVFLAI